MYVSALLSKDKLHSESAPMKEKPNIPDELEVELVKTTTTLCQKKFEFLFNG